MMNNKLHSIFEYQEIRWDNFSNIAKIKKSLNELEKQGIKLFSYTANGIKSRQYVGVVSLAGNVIQVLPKIFNNPISSSEFDISNNITGLMYLLKITKKLNITETNLSKLSKHNDLLEIFIYLFASNLFEMLTNDFQRNYVNREDNLNYVKGAINFTQHIRYNHIDKSKFYCNYDEYEDNILLNQLFKATVKKCIQFSKLNFNILQKCDGLLTNVDDRNFIDSNVCNQIKFNRRNQNYKYIFELAKLLLFGNSPKIHADNMTTFSIMFDMNKLFEESVYEILKQYQHELKITKLVAQSKQETIFNTGKYNFTLQPDIVLCINSEQCIIDTKYKLIDVIKPERNSNKKGISQADIYQIFAYCKYYKANTGILLYPKYVENNPVELEHTSQAFKLKVEFLDFILNDKVKYKDYINGLYKQLVTMLRKQEK